MHKRENALNEWLITVIKHSEFTLAPLTGDASFRKYFRLHTKNSTFIVMDAPPEKEALEPFVHIANTLTQASIQTPEILAQNMEQGFLLLSDFGDQLLLAALYNETADNYYQEALNTLFKIQECSVNDPKLPLFDPIFMLKEMNLCPEWFFKNYLSLELNADENFLIQNTMEWVATEVSLQPQVFIHRDYHSRNLMLIPNTKTISLGVIDFQDAMRGPLTYDLVSLLKDCYIAWPRERVLEWVAFFHARSAYANGYSLAKFIRAFDLCGLQRHLKVLGVFSRLYLRDNKPGYLADLPLTLKYIHECCEIYEELHPFFHFLQNRVYLP